MNDALLAALYETIRQHIDETDDDKQMLDVVRTVAHFASETTEEILDALEERLE